MPRTTTHSIRVTFGDGDPAGIDFFPHAPRWMNTSSRSFFMQGDAAPRHQTEKTRGIGETPLLEFIAKFVKSATDAQTLLVTTHVEGRRPKVFIQMHRIARARADGTDDLICEGRDVRAFVKRNPDNHRRLPAIPVPEDNRLLCS